MNDNTDPMTLTRRGFNTGALASLAVVAASAQSPDSVPVTLCTVALRAVFLIILFPGRSLSIGSQRHFPGVGRAGCQQNRREQREYE